MLAGHVAYAQQVSWNALAAGPRADAPALSSPGDEYRPIDLAAADFDEDGVDDLLVLYRGEHTVLALHPGRIERLVSKPTPAPPDRASSRSGRRQARAAPPTAPFTRWPSLTEAPPASRITAGDFDADGHADALLIGASGRQLMLLGGNGRGGFRAPEKRRLPGRATHWEVGEIDRRDGLPDLVLALERAEGPGLALLSSAAGAWRSNAEIVSLETPVTDLELTRVDGDAFTDVAVASGARLLVLAGRDRSGPVFGAAREVLDARTFAEPVAALAGGAASGWRRPGLVIALASGELLRVGREQPPRTTVAAEAEPAPIPPRPAATPATAPHGPSWPAPAPGRLNVTRIATAPATAASRFRPVGRPIRPSSGGVPTDGLFVASKGRSGLRMLHWVARERSPRSRLVLDPSFGRIERILPMRLGPDAFPDFVLLLTDRREPAIVVSAGAAALIVNTTADSNDGSCDPAPSGDCTLREALNAANLNPGLDSIHFSGLSAGDHTIAVGEPPDNLGSLPIVTDPVVIDGTTHPDGLVELDGSAAGPTANGLQVNFGLSTIRGLVINRFSPFSGLVLAFGSGNIVEGNLIGTDTSGTLDLGNGGNGLLIIESRSNTVGGTTAAARNVISGNQLPAVAVSGTGATANTIAGNYVGTDSTGDVALPTTSNLVLIHEGAANNTVGGTAPGAGNVISGAFDPNLPAISIVGDTGAGGGLPVATTGNLVQGNLIGTDRTGALALGNASAAVFIGRNAPANTIGGTAPGAGNVVSASGVDGIRIEGGLTTGSVIQGNRIGTDAAGTGPLPNGANGVLITAGASSATVGGATTGAGNVIAFNAADGVALDSGSSNSVLGNSVFANGALAIDLCAAPAVAGAGCLDPAAVTPNDAGDGDGGANGLQNFPVLDLATTTDDTVEGSLASLPNTVFDLAFYENPTCDGSGHGEAETYLGSSQAVTDANGDVTFSVPPGAPLGTGAWIAATATDPAGNTSELSACRVACGAVRDLVLELQIVSAPAEFTACSTILAFNGFQVDADVTLRSGRTISLGSGFSVRSAATLRLVIDPLVQ